ncbi:related to calcium P-type ATPase NCA-3 [Cephalotrichum gorgonifer]|uniref:Calcium-transporting ATPase n=1 Tax=Cephalotrichum gorgonifer TaxID=2041049 RepID=A0AAE8SV99_9PEZI|nr:related to calcium P-type ATPase NCA-3 [Cephalotrichum gorgonifer]
MEELFRPIPTDEELFRDENNPFAFSPGHLSRFLNPKNLRVFLALGGLAGIEKGLRTDAKSGLSPDETDLADHVSWEDATGSQKPEYTLSSNPKSQTKHPKVDILPSHHHKRGDSFSDRKRIFGVNVLPEVQSKSFLMLVWIALQDKVLILLSIAAVVSLALGLYQTFGQEAHEGGGLEWIEGVAIIVAIAVVSLVGALNDWKKERQFQKLNKKKEDRQVKVIRSGKPSVISINDILVGDLLMLEQGDVIPVDGIFVDGHNISCDESSATGESDVLKKTPAATAFRILQNPEQEGDKIKKLDPFILSGAKVLDGVGTCIVTAVGPHSTHGRTMLSLRDNAELTPLQMKLNLLAGYIAKLGSLAGLLLFAVLFIEFLVRLKHSTETPDEKGQNFMTILITAITIIVVAVPEGLPLAVTLALSFATKKMTRENNLVRHLQSCETMGNATVICSDKTGTLTENVMTVVAGSLGNGGLVFGDQNVLDHLNTDSSTEATAEDTGAKKATSQRDMVLAGSLAPKIHDDLRQLLNLSIGVNTTAFEDTEDGKKVFIGTKTETALLDWAKNNFALDSLEVVRSNHPAVEMYPFNSSRKCMGAVIRLPEKKYRVFVKGAPEILLAQCHKVLDSPARGLHSESMDQEHNALILQDISRFASLSLRTLGLCYRDLDQWPPARSRSANGDSDAVEFSDIFREMTWIGAVGIQDPVRRGVSDAVKQCTRAGVGVKMVTGDNIQTATAIAKACGLLENGGRVMEGVEFRRMNDIERANIVGDLRVLARSSPEDKRVLVKALQSKGEIVAVTGDGTNDAPALKAADVGFSMGVTGTEVAKEASDIILLDDNFTSIVIALSWGRAINDAVKKFLQFQITVNITAVLLTFISAVSNDHGESVLTAVQLLWVNLIMDTFAALALATDPPNESLLDRKPEPRTAPLITLTMWKMIIGQSIYQLAVTLVLYFAGPKFLHYPAKQQSTLIFNTFVFMQIFKLVNSRRIDNKLNIFEGLMKNQLFMLMASIMVAGQVLIVFVGSDAFSVTRITGAQWGISLVLGFISIPVGVLIRCVPDSWIRACIPAWFKRRRAEKSGEGYDLNAAMLDVRDDLAFFNRLRGGRMAFLCDPRFIQKQIQQAKRRGSTASTSPMYPAVGMSGLLAASIGGLPSPSDARHGSGHAVDDRGGAGGEVGRA